MAETEISKPKKWLSRVKVIFKRRKDPTTVISREDAKSLPQQEPVNAFISPPQAEAKEPTEPLTSPLKVPSPVLFPAHPTSSAPPLLVKELPQPQPDRPVIENNALALPICFAPGKQYFACTSAEHDIRLWEFKTSAYATLFRTLGSHDDVVSDIVISQDGKFLASASLDKTVRIWDLAVPKLKPPVETHTLADGATALAFSPDGKKLAGGSLGNMVHIWDLRNRESCLELEGHGGSVSSVAFSPNGMRLASGSSDETIRIWDAIRGALLMELNSDSGPVSSVAFASDNRHLVSAGSADVHRSVRIWDRTTGSCLHTLAIPAAVSGIHFVSFSYSGSKLACGLDDRTVHFWDLNLDMPLETSRSSYRGLWSIPWEPGDISRKLFDVSKNGLPAVLADDLPTEDPDSESRAKSHSSSVPRPSAFTSASGQVSLLSAKSVGDSSSSLKPLDSPKTCYMCLGYINRPGSTDACRCREW